MNLASAIAVYGNGGTVRAMGYAYPGTTAVMDVMPTFHPPSERNPRRIPVDDPGETDDRFLDVTKRNSKAIAALRQRLSRQGGVGTPKQQVVSTLVQPHSGVYLPFATSGY